MCLIIKQLNIKQVNKLFINLLQEILQSSPSSLVLPAVDCKATKYLLSVLQESRDWKLTNVTNLNVSQLEVNASNPNLLVVQLQPLARWGLTPNRTDPHVCVIFRAFENVGCIQEIQKNKVEACRTITIVSLTRMNSVIFKVP